MSITLTLFLFSCTLLIFAESANIRESEIGLWICKGHKHGDQIPHPEDCHAYFVCDRDMPKLVICHGNLHYDSRQQVCNWPEAANCILGEYPPYWESSPRPIVSTVYPVTEESTKAEIRTTKFEDPSTEPPKTTKRAPITTIQTSTTHCNTIPPYVTTVKPRNSTIGSTDLDGKLVDPMKTYDPKKVQCLYNGLYFLPHPGDCQKYFICANHILYLHSCGILTNWNYKTQHCDYAEFSQCYLDEENVKSTIITTTKSRRSPKTPPIKTTKNIELPEIITTPRDISTTIKDILPECPPEQQKFFAHPTDCTKYYICIRGRPALTKCPEGLWWDERDEWCGRPEYSYCKAGIK